jgi:hypothetical protein
VGPRQRNCDRIPGHNGDNLVFRWRGGDSDASSIAVTLAPARRHGCHVRNRDAARGELLRELSGDALIWSIARAV